MLNKIKGIVLGTLPINQLQFIKKLYYAYRLRFAASLEELDFMVIRKLVKSGEFVVDIGSNIGVYSKLLSGLVGNTGKVYSFEPVPQTFEILSSNIKKLGLKNVEIINCAISDTPDSVIMEVPLYETGGENLYEARIINKESYNSLRKIKIESKTIDSLFETAPYRVSFIKCDAEGHELECIKGAKGITNKHKPAWLIEISQDPDMPGSKACEIFRFFKEIGYEAFWFDGNNLKKRGAGEKSLNYFFLTTAHEQLLQELL